MAALLLAVALQIAIPHLISPPLIGATLQDNCAYTCGVVRSGSDAKWTSGGGSLWVLKTALKEGSKITSLDHMIGVGGNRSALLRWQLIDRRLTCMRYYGRIDPGDSVSDIGILLAVPLRAVELANANSGRSKLDAGHREYKKLFEQGPFNYPFEVALRSAHDDSITRQIFFDFWCREDKRYEIFVTEPDQGNRLTRHDFHPEWTSRLDPASGDFAPNPAPLWDKSGKWTFDWKGPFYVAPIWDDRYFVTETGRVFVAPRKPKPGTALKELWKGPPVDALIHDSDAKTWYAFTKDQFFEIADPIKPKPHTIPIRRAWTADEAVITAAKCGRVIRSLPAPPMTERTWDDLASPEARISHNAVWAMTNEPARAVTLLNDRLKPVQLPPANELAALIDDLGADAYAKREAAQKRLREFGYTIEPVVRDAVAKTSSTEARGRLKKLLTPFDSRTPDEVRAERAVRALERIDTAEARRLLQEWAKGADTAVLTREARKALHP